MTDNNIIKALEHCLYKDHRQLKCTECEYTTGCKSWLMREALDLINRQRAEIEKLQKDCADIDTFARALCEGRLLKGKAVADFEDLQEYIRKQKAEAVKEFVERLKCRIGEIYHSVSYMVDLSKVYTAISDNLKEMTEGGTDGR